MGAGGRVSSVVGSVESRPAVRVGVVDIGTNSTRLLIADAADGAVSEIERRSTVTRLGDGVDATGALGEHARARVLATLEDYVAAIDAHGCEARPAVMTSAVRDAANGAEFAATVRDRFGLDARTLSGEEEARLTFLGATAARDPADPTELLVADIGGGSTELVVGSGGGVGFHVSTQAGVVRHSERHLHRDPPTAPERRALAADVRAVVREAVPDDVRARVAAAVAVAGTATSCAAIDLALDPYDARRVEGHPLSLAVLEAMLERLAGMTLARRREVTGLDPARAPVIVAGVIILVEVMRAFGLDRVAASEHDILWGVALAAARRAG
jgi:exopolyphosphatase / guanosine-5'-triphosphate,3'-diphosphate pyrophosphatase